MTAVLSKAEEVVSGFRRAGGCLLGVAWLGLVFAGIVEAFGTEANFLEGHHPSRVLGYFLLATAAIIFVTTADRWKRAFPGIMIAATLGALLELEQGHAVNNPSVLVPRSTGFVQLVVIAGVTGLSFTFKKRPLHILDRIALLVFAASIFLGGEQEAHRQMPFALFFGAVCVLLAWTINRLRISHRIEG